MPIKGAKLTQPFASCSMDLITDLPPVDGCDSILVVVDTGNKGGNSHPNDKNFDARRGRSISFGQPLQMIWLT
jgi:hypothetical protein